MNVNSIFEIDRTINPVGVVGSIRQSYGSVGELSRVMLREEIAIAKASEAAEPGYLKTVAYSYSLGDLFEDWEERMTHL